MHTNNIPAHITLSGNTLLLGGSWTLAGIESLTDKIDALLKIIPTDCVLDCHGIAGMDTAGAWVFNKFLVALKKQNISYTIINLDKEHQHVLELITKRTPLAPAEIPVPKPAYTRLERIGKFSVEKVGIFEQWLDFIGLVFLRIVGTIRHPARFRWKYFLNILEINGYRALPIIGFLSFLIGVVITYETGLQLRNYGANIYIISLLGTAMFREFAPLMSAIIIAGRTGSAFTAQLGVMQINEEIDALRTMGHSPTEMLVIPRILGIIVAMPLLVVWADIFGVFGGMVMSKSILNLGYATFIRRFPSDVTLTSFNIGLIKAPVFALIIAAVGCFEGFRVSGSSESIGLQTTKSVVLAIFLIIIADATFAIVLSWLNI